MLECNFKLFSRVCFACIYNLPLENVQDCHSLSWHVLRSPVFIQCPVFGGSPIYMYVYSCMYIHVISCIWWDILLVFGGAYMYLLGLESTIILR